ncbi:MAG TPA: SDR family oxidoreductase [Anaeromyxobacteraceae bacterium]|nr:SDR family oxidoreductase [Anaeromyxobacteraceae bacterium]
MSDKPLILVTGATGNTGSGLVPKLLAAGARVRALVHDPAKAERLRKLGAEAVVADLGKPETLGAALAGVDRIYLCLFNGPDQAIHGRNLIAAARKAGRPHVVYHAASGSDRSRIIRHIAEVEHELRASGLTWTILRPTFYLQNMMMAIPTVKSQGTIYLPMKDGRMAMTDVRDIVDVAAKLLLEGGHLGKTYTLTTPASFTIAEFADALGKEIGKPVKYVAVPIPAARESMVGMGMDPWIADGYMELLEDFANNWGDKTSRDAETLLGHPARGYQQFCVDFKTAFAAA